MLLNPWHSTLHPEKVGALVIAECLPPRQNSPWSTKLARDGGSGENDARLMEEMDRRALRYALVPSATFNGRIAGSRRYTERALDKRHKLYAISEEGGELLPGEALLCAAGGCMLVIGVGWPNEDSPRVIVAHAGRDSLIDRGRITGKEPRESEGVLSSIKETFRSWGIHPHQAEVHGFFSIAPSEFLHPLDHPEWGEFNRLLLRDMQERYGNKVMYTITLPDGRESVALDMPALLEAQARKLHFGAASTSGTLQAAGDFAYTTHPSPALSGKIRNLVIIRYIGKRTL